MSQCFPKSESKDIWMKDVGKRNGDVEQKKKKKTRDGHYKLGDEGRLEDIRMRG